MAASLLHPVDWFNARFNRLLQRISNVDRYELKDGVITRHRGWFTTERVPIREIKSWRVEYEMTFDIVYIDVDWKSPLVWFDVDNDLLAILRTEIRDRELLPVGN